MALPATTESTAPPEKLDRAEIWRRYPNEWVVLVDMDDDGAQVTAAVVFAHSPRRAEAREAARGLRSVGIFWTGPIRGVLWKFGVHRPL